MPRASIHGIVEELDPRRAARFVVCATLIATPGPTAFCAFGGFGSPMVFQFADCPTCSPLLPVAADFNGDGFKDVIVVFTSFQAPGSQAFIMLNSGNGTFVRLPSMDTSAVAAVDAGDVDGDGDVDVVTVSSSGTAFRVLANNGAGIVTLTQSGGFPGGATPTDVLLVDVDHDGDLDAVAALEQAGAIAVALNDGFGAFGGWSAVPIGRFPREIVAGDLDGDGWADLVFTDRTFQQAGVGVMKATGPGEFGPPGFVGVGPSPSNPSLVRLDADADLDVTVLNGMRQVMRLLNDGDGALSSPAPIFGVPGGEFSPGPYALADIDGDLDADLVVTGSWEVFASSPILMQLNNGDGTFQSIPSIGPQRSGTGLILADVDGNASTDLLFASRKFTGMVQPPDPLPGTLSSYLNLTATAPPSPFTLLGPANGLQGVPLPQVSPGPGGVTVIVKLAWSASRGTNVLYHVRVARDPALTDVALDTVVSAQELAVPVGVLDAGDTYWWGVTALQGFGATLSSPETFVFGTAFEGANPCPVDLNGDGVVGAADLGLLLAAWGLCD